MQKSYGRFSNGNVSFQSNGAYQVYQHTAPKGQSCVVGFFKALIMLAIPTLGFYAVGIINKSNGNGIAILAFVGVIIATLVAFKLVSK